MTGIKPSKMPLEGIRVLEVGQLIGGPFAGMLLSGFGAEVIKVEPPKLGDPMRKWRKMHGDTSLWWYTIARNKKSVTLDLRVPEGQEIFRSLVAKDVDIVIENFRPGRMEEWGIGYEDLKLVNPRLVMVRVSGWGQTGPYAQRPGFASVAEAIGGLRYVMGVPDRPPVRAGISIGDSLAGIHAAFGALMAIYHRDVSGSGRGQLVDTAIYESVFNMMESLLPEYDVLGHIRERSGTSLPGIVPSNTYLCKDETYIIIGGNNDSIFKRLMKTIGRDDLANDPRFEHNDGRAKHAEEIDAAIEQWTKQQKFEDAFNILEAADVPTGPIYSIADIMQDPQYIAREMFEQVKLPDEKQMKVPRMVPLLQDTPGKTKWIGPKLGEHNDEIYGKHLGLDADRLEALRSRQII